MCRMEGLWQEKHPAATLDMTQLNNQRYSIIKKHLLTDLEQKKLSRLAELKDTVQKEVDVASDSPAETPNVLIDEPPLFAKNLSTDIQTLRQNIMAHLSTEQGQGSYLLKLRSYSLMRYWQRQTWLWKLYLRSKSPKLMH